MFDRHRHKTPPARVLGATLAGAALFISAPAAAQDAHGVIAFGETDSGDGVAYGFAWNFPAKDTAHAEAVNACISSGGTNCIQLAWFQNGCGALAIDQHGNAQGKPGMTREQAEARALRTCEAAGGAGCNIVGSLCATADGDPGTYSGRESVLPVQDAQTTVTGPADESLTREERLLVQQTLTALGFDAGPADGVFGRRTRAAILEWQNASGHEATGYVTREQAATLTAVDASPDQAQEPRLEAADNQSENVLIFGPGTGPKCSEWKGYEEGYCWHEIANKSGCFVLLRSFAFWILDETHQRLIFDPSISVTWSGGCLGDMAHGKGTLHQTRHDSSWGLVEDKDTGEIVQGNRQGHWVSRWTTTPQSDSQISAGGCIEEGQYVDSKRSGKWIMRCDDGTGGEDQYVDGERVESKD